MKLNSTKLKIPGGSIDIYPIVFLPSAALLILFVTLTAIFPEQAMIALGSSLDWISHKFSWLYILSMTIFLILSLYLVMSKYGTIKLGPDDSKPEFSRPSWFAMLFSAGMGIGMLFFGVVEPLTHFQNPPSGTTDHLKAASEALSTTIFHWALHPWGLYAITGLALAFFSFRKKLPLSLRSVFYPLLGKRIFGRWGDGIDILAILATLFGLATSLGLGAKQVNAGMNFVLGWPGDGDTQAQIIIIAAITALAVISLISGLHIGIKYLSNLNMLLALILLVFLFLAGPSNYLLGALVENTGNYLQTLPHRAFWTASYADKINSDWFSNWTVFYWGWWIAWSPFVGMFIARISRGRTIREFISGVLIVPCLVAILWMTVFGNSAIWYSDHKNTDQKIKQANVYDVQVLDEQTGLAYSADKKKFIVKQGTGDTLVALDLKSDTHKWITNGSKTPVKTRQGVLIHQDTKAIFVPQANDVFTETFLFETRHIGLKDYLSSPVLNESHTKKRDTTATALFVLLNYYPFAKWVALLATLCLILFFITSSDSASMVADIIASGGNHNPSRATRIFWGISEGLLAAVLLISGGLRALQSGSIALGLVLCILLLIMCFSLLKGLKAELKESDEE